MRKPLAIALVVMLASAVSACGRDESQEKVGATSAQQAGTPAGGGTGAAAQRGPLQTGELPKNPQLPEGTTTGGRTTPPPQ